MTDLDKPQRRPGPAPRVAIVIGALLAIFVTAQSALGFGLAVTSPPLAARIAPNHGPALGAFVEYRVRTSQSPREFDEIEALARRTLRLAPLDFDAARSVGALDIARKNLAPATKLLKLVSTATLREPISHAWILDRAFVNKDFQTVVDEADIVLRQSDSMRDSAFPMLNMLVADGAVVDKLAQLLASNPPWRGSYLFFMGEKGTARANEYRLLKQLAKTDSPPTSEELRVWFLIGLAEKPADTLFAQFRALSTRALKPEERYLRDGDFEGNDLPQPFTWVFYPQEGGFAEADTTPDGTGRALYIEFDSRTPVSLAAQLLSVPPGKYRLTARSYALTDMSEGQIALQLVCQNGEAAAELERLPLNGVVDEWRKLLWEIDIPKGCQGPMLWISGRPASLAKAERLYLDDLKIAPLS